MKVVKSTLFLSAALFAAGCGEMVDNSGCDLTKTSVKAGSWPNEQARAKAEDHLKLAREAREKKDFKGCEQHRQDAEAALKP